MRATKALTYAAIALFSSLTLTAIADDPASEASVKELMSLTGAGNLGVQMAQNLLPALKQIIPQAPESFWTEFMKGVNADDLVKLVIPIYQKHFTEKEIRETLAFYRTPTGQKILKELPQVMQESMATGQQWGQDIARRAVEKAKAENVKTQ